MYVVLTADFTTTGKVESILSTACIMHAFKPYFDYRRMMCICGIRQVHFMGKNCHLSVCCELLLRNFIGAVKQISEHVLIILPLHASGKHLGLTTERIIFKRFTC